jgi:hypothetical protein
MTVHTSLVPGRDFDPGARGYAVLYRASAINHCPGCGRSNWLVGRSTAQCAFCDTALPLEAHFRRNLELGG